MEKMDYLIRTKLVQQLGEATQELKLRVGIHSGSVTAGVLRGDRARFQVSIMSALPVCNPLNTSLTSQMSFCAAFW